MWGVGEWAQNETENLTCYTSSTCMPSRCEGITLYGMVYFRLQETVEQSLGPKVNSVISSNVTLCPSDKPHPPRPLKKASSHAPSEYITVYIEECNNELCSLSLQLPVKRLMFEGVREGDCVILCI